MQIKAQGLLNAAQWIEAEHGRARLDEILRACSPPLRERYTTATAIQWHPVEEFVEFLERSETALGAAQSRGKVAEAIGAAGARANMRGTLVRLALWLTTQDILMKRLPAVWGQFNDEGSLAVLHLDERLARVELAGLKRTHPLFCASVNGWFRAFATAVSKVTPMAKHVECKGRGDPRCVFEIRYQREVPAST